MLSTQILWTALVTVIIILIIFAVPNKLCIVKRIYHTIHGLIGKEHYDMFYSDDDDE